MKKTRIIAAVLAVLLTVPMLCMAVQAHTFKDVTDYNEAISALSDVHIITGYDENTFKPDLPVARWHMTLLVAKMISGDCRNSTWETEAEGFTFEDIQDHQFKNSIKFCFDRGLIIGRDEEGKVFDPEGGITLQEAATFVIRALGYPRDEYEQEWPKAYLAKATSLGLFKGLESVEYTDALTRGQTAQILYNAFNLPRYDKANGTETLDPFSKMVYTYDKEDSDIEVTGTVANYVMIATENDVVKAPVTKSAPYTLTFAPLKEDGTYDLSKDSLITLGVQAFADLMGDGAKTPANYLGGTFEFTVISDSVVSLRYLEKTK